MFSVSKKSQGSWKERVLCSCWVRCSEVRGDLPVDGVESSVLAGLLPSSCISFESA